MSLKQFLIASSKQVVHFENESEILIKFGSAMDMEVLASYHDTVVLLALSNDEKNSYLHVSANYHVRPHA